ncbi:MAG: efflux RND transporter periplasmic adaptor subunit [Bacteroidetes bacterium]|nr:efflux RND transporter periplasmic adaptor subunit [Bacteroidota bacterium]
MSSPRSIHLRSALLLASLMVLGLTACQKADVAEEGPKEPLRLTDSIRTRLHVQTDSVRTMMIEDDLLLTGKVMFDQDHMVRVAPLAGGIVQEVRVELGDQVRKGQVLAVIRSTEIMDVSDQQSQAQSDVAIASKNLETTEALFKAGLASEREFVTAQRELDKAKADEKRASEVASLYGGATSSTYIVRAPASGFIVAKNITDNSQFRTDQPEAMFAISDLSNVWVIANVYESDIAYVREGAHADVKTLAYDDETFQGVIDKIYNALDPTSRVMKVRVRIKNDQFRLKPEMFASVSIQMKEPRSMTAVPSSAVIFDKNKHYVLTLATDGTLAAREVQTYKAIGDYTYVTGGISHGDQVITQGQLVLFNALTSR